MIISEVKCKLFTMKGQTDPEKSRDFLMYVYNALNKYHSIVIDDSEFVHDSHKTKHKYEIKYDKFLWVEALYFCIDIELIADYLISYSRDLLCYKSLDNLCILSSNQVVWTNGLEHLICSDIIFMLTEITLQQHL